MGEIPFNVNHRVKARLTNRGREIQARYFQPSDGPQPDSEGWRTYQMWEFMLIFGPYCYMGPEPPFETNIRIMVDGSERDALRAEVERYKRAHRLLCSKLAKRLDCPYCPAQEACQFPAVGLKCADSLSEWAISEARKGE